MYKHRFTILPFLSFFLASGLEYGQNLWRIKKSKLRSTSIHNLNADKGIGNLQKMFYLLFNWINNSLPNTNISNSLIIRDFICEDFKDYWGRLDIKSSPSRKLSDLFWLKLPWVKIREELGIINVLDTGCGSGNYGCRLSEYSNNNINRYTGIDIYRNDNWASLEAKYSNFQFYKVDYKDISAYIPEGTNFFMSQSTIEHFEEDLYYFEQIRNYILSYKKNVIQVHLFPSSFCLQLYRFHGIRQYTPRTIKKIVELFQDFSYAILFKLGGKECNRLHHSFITIPFCKGAIDPRDTKIQEYDRRLCSAIEQDMKRPQRFPSFYALIIHSNWNRKIFDE